MPRDVWDALGPENSFYISHDWLAWVERDQGAVAEYVLVRHGGRLLGALPLYHVHDESNDAYLPQALHEGRWGGRYLIAGTRRAYSNDLLVRDDLEPSRRRAVIGSLLDAAQSAVAEAGADGALFLYLSTPAAMALLELRPDLQPLLAVADMTLPVTGGGVRWRRSQRHAGDRESGSTPGP